MELQQGVLAVKICELAKEYGLLQSRIQICQEKNPEQLSKYWNKSMMNVKLIALSSSKMPAMDGYRLLQHWLKRS